MAKGRMLKKTISTSRKLAELNSNDARLLYTWLLPHLDVEGRFSADPAVVRGLVVPRIKSYTTKKVQEYLDDMNKVGLITLYEANGDIYLELHRFKDFQVLREGREAASDIPPPTDSRRIPDGEVRPKIREDKLSKDKLSKDKLSKQEDFDLFWKFYPKKKSKGQAERAFLKINPDEQLLAIMLATIEQAKKSEDWQKEGGKYIPHPATWLNAKGWEDEFRTAAQDKHAGIKEWLRISEAKREAIDDREG